jgi:predicted phage terminase large subunit-like protein
MGSLEAAGQLQQRPAPAEGALVKTSWWKTYPTLPDNLEAMCIAVDLTFGASATSDYCVFIVAARKGPNIFIVDMVRKRMTFTESVKAFVKLCQQYPNATAKYIEAAANGKAMIDTLRSQIPGLIAVTPLGSKEARAAAVAPLIEAGNVHLPAQASWLEDFLSEWQFFPAGKNDDIVDSSTLAISQLSAKTEPTDWMPISISGPSLWDDGGSQTPWLYKGH